LRLFEFDIGPIGHRKLAIGQFEPCAVHGQRARRDDLAGLHGFANKLAHCGHHFDGRLVGWLARIPVWIINEKLHDLLLLVLSIVLIKKFCTLQSQAED